LCPIAVEQVRMQGNWGSLVRAQLHLRRLQAPRRGTSRRVRDHASAWTLAHDAWLRRQRFESRPLQLALEESYAAAVQAEARRDLLDRAIAELAAEPPFAETVGRLC
jgi:transposase